MISCYQNKNYRSVVLGLTSGARENREIVLCHQMICHVKQTKWRYYAFMNKGEFFEEKGEV
jgi:hypothetical protein